MSAIMRSGAAGNGAAAPRGAFMRSGAVKQFKKKVEIEERKVDEAQLAEAEEFFVCEECGMEAKSKAGLGAHKRSHNQEV